MLLLRLRLAPYFQMVLAPQPEYAGPLRVRQDTALTALYFENPRNTFRTGPAFVALSSLAARVETNRGRFFGAGRGVAHPTLVEHGEPDVTHAEDDCPIAAVGFGFANGLCHTAPLPENCAETLPASASMDSSSSQLT